MFSNFIIFVNRLTLLNLARDSCSEPATHVENH